MSPAAASPPPRDPDQPAPWFRSYSASSVGIEIVVATVMGLGAGLWLEKNVTHWSPWTTLIGLGVGLGAAGKAIARTIAEMRRASEREAALHSAETRDGGEGGDPA